MSNITIYTTPTCGYCRLAKAFFQEHNVSYKEIDVSQDPAAAQEMVAKSHQMGVPVIDLDGQIVVGFDKPRLAQHLGIV